MAAVRLANVLCSEKFREAILSGSPRRPRLRSSGAKVKSLVRSEHYNGHCAYPGRAMKEIKRARVVGRFQVVGFDQLLRGLDVRRPLRRRQRALQRL
jgi:hypothetical protein